MCCSGGERQESANSKRVTERPGWRSASAAEGIHQKLGKKKQQNAPTSGEHQSSICALGTAGSHMDDMDLRLFAHKVHDAQSEDVGLCPFSHRGRKLKHRNDKAAPTPHPPLHRAEAWQRHVPPPVRQIPVERPGRQEPERGKSEPGLAGRLAPSGPRGSAERQARSGAQIQEISPSVLAQEQTPTPSQQRPSAPAPTVPSQ